MVIDGYDGLAGLRVDEVEVAEPGPAEVRVAVAAAGIGPWDVFTADGAFAELLDDAELVATFPMVLGWDLAGVIEEARPDAGVDDERACPFGGSDARPGRKGEVSKTPRVRFSFRRQGVAAADGSPPGAGNRDLRANRLSGWRRATASALALCGSAVALGVLPLR